MPESPPSPSADAPHPSLEAVRPSVAGIILAGGAGRRMDAPALGAPAKPLVQLAGRPLIAHAMERLRPQVSTLSISANDPDAFAPLGLPILPDPLPDLPGPLAGILAGLEQLAAALGEGGGPQLLLSVPADAPFLPEDLAQRLFARAMATGRPVCAASLGRRHPVIALWPLAAREALRAHLERGERRVGHVLDLLGGGSLDWPARSGDPFFNVNTPQDLEIAHSRLTASL